MATYQHEVTLRVEHAGAKSLVPVAEDDDVEADRLRYGQKKGQHPDGHDLKDGQQRDAHPLNPAPGCYSPVPVKGRDPVRTSHRLASQRSTYQSIKV